MSHPDPLYDPENSYEDDEMNPNYDDHDDFFDEDSSNYHPDAAYELSTHIDDEEDEEWDDSYDDSMDGDAESAFDSIGWGCDEQYGYYGEDF